MTRFRVAALMPVPRQPLAAVPVHAAAPAIPLASAARAGHSDLMFTIEHEFDSTVITLVDEGGPYLQEDVIINAFAECVTIEQFDARTNEVQRITLSPEQLRDLAAALDLPEGVYRLVLEKNGR